MATDFNPGKACPVLWKVLAVALPFFAFATAYSEEQFSMRPSFIKLLAARSAHLPSPAEKNLLERHRPELYLAVGQKGPLDFYRDYISSGCLTANALQGKDCSVTSETLNRVKDDPDALFVHMPDGAQTHPVSYGSVQKATIVLPGTEPRVQEWHFLLYHFVFRTSGLPAKLGWWQNLGAFIFGDLDDWHQLDHYTHLAVALGPDKQPQAVMVQQHNYMRTFLVGADEPAFSATGPIAVDAAIRSNELYPHRNVRTEHPSVGFITASNAAFLTGTERRPMFAAYDVTDGTVKVDYELKFLPPNDAFYTFIGSLGERRLLPGRDGPPGAMYNTLPELVPFENSLAFFYWVAQDREFAELLGEWEKKPSEEIRARQRERFAEALRGIR